jgi:hypothetical protein
MSTQGVFLDANNGKKPAPSTTAIPSASSASSAAASAPHVVLRDQKDTKPSAAATNDLDEQARKMTGT